MHCAIMQDHVPVRHADAAARQQRRQTGTQADRTNHTSSSCATGNGSAHGGSTHSRRSGADDANAVAFEDLFEACLGWKVLCIGLYRRDIDTSFPFVYTDPVKQTILWASDDVYVICSNQTLAVLHQEANRASADVSNGEQPAPRKASVSP